MSAILLVSIGYLLVDTASRSRLGPSMYAAWLVSLFRHIMVRTIVPVLSATRIQKLRHP